MKRDGVIPGSFRDPSGFVFRRDGVVYRYVSGSALPDLEELETSGLYARLVEERLLIPHEDADARPPRPRRGGRVIRPRQVPFVSYPYEWCFGQLRDAALATAEIQLRALDHGMTLKDASAFNIQFLDGRPQLIDTLSFTAYREGSPWVAYKQFCEHFLAPLLLMRYVDPLLGRLSALTADGIPLSVTARLLPLRTRLSPSALLHVHLHARSIRHYGQEQVPGRVRSRGLSSTSLKHLVESLRNAVGRLDWSPRKTEWANYEDEHGYGDTGMEAKLGIVASLLDEVGPDVAWDLGANTGAFSRVAARTGARVVSIDADPAAVEANYRRTRKDGDVHIHPLLVDLTAPSPGLGWAEDEREGLTSRSDADVVLALALVHHLAIGSNVPLGRILDWLAMLAPQVIVEFVPKEDPQARRLLVSREDVFADYSLKAFDAAFRDRFTVHSIRAIPGVDRVLYHGRRIER